MLLKENGRMSSSKRTRHINIRYFFVQDRIQAGDLNIEHCPIKEMTADFFTKPLQGAAFYKFRDLILNYKASWLQECVEEQNVTYDNIGRLATNNESPKKASNAIAYGNGSKKNKNNKLVIKL